MSQVQSYDPNSKQKSPRENKRKRDAKEDSTRHGKREPSDDIKQQSTPQDEEQMSHVDANEQPTLQIPQAEMEDPIEEIFDSTFIEEDVDVSGIDREASVVEPSRQEFQFALQISKLPLADVAKAWKLAPFLIRNLQRDGFESFFPIQALSIPDVITSERHPHVRAQDIFITAPTGSGKTLSYVIPILNALSGRLVRRLSALVILPSRDLAMQVFKVLESYAQGSDLSVGLAVGQSDFEAEQIAITVDPDRDDAETIMHRLDIEPGNLDLALEIHGGLAEQPLVQSTFVGTDMLVCTPGRLVDHMDNTPGFTLQHLKFLVVDEADRLLSERYQNWIDRVLTNAKIPSTAAVLSGVDDQHSSGMERRTGESHRSSKDSDGGFLLSDVTRVRRQAQLRKFLVSATMTSDPQKLESLGLVNPKFFNVHRMLGAKQSKGGADKFTVPESLQEFTVDCTSEQKPLVLCAAILQHQKETKNSGMVAVFTASVESTHRLARLLQLIWQSAGYGDQGTVLEFSSALTQDERTLLVKRCGDPDGGLSVVVCSDGMSRGIDIERIELVVNYDIPLFAKTYIHRCGRTARAGKVGKAISILRKDQVQQYKKMRKQILSPGRVKALSVDKSLARSVVAVYKPCLASLRELLEAEERGELSHTEAIPPEILVAD